ncbi:extracellular solute-binding protein [Rathayibacter sp. CAU 1779]
MSRRTALGLGLGIAATGLLAACTGTGGGASGGGAGVAEASAFKLPTHVPPKTVPGGLISKVAGMPPTYTSPPKSYFTSVTVPPGDGSEVSSFQILWGAPPDPLEKNLYWQQVDKNMNIKFNPTLVPSDSYNDKMATVIASGDIPDLLFVQDTTAIGSQAISNGVFADLSKVLAGDGILKWPNLANIQTGTWQASQKNGHIYGIPNENAYLSNFPVIRYDLMKKAGHSEFPKDADGFKAMLTDMAKLKSVNGIRFWPIAGLTGLVQGMFQWMFRAGTGWQLDGGKLVNVIETDAFEQTLKYERELWSAGVFHPDALSLASQTQKNAGLFGTGQAAIHLDSVNGFFGASILTKLTSGSTAVKGADPKFLVPPGHDGGKIVVPRDSGYWGIVAISAKAAQDPKKLKQLLGVCNYWRAPYGSKESLFINSGIEGVNYKFDDDMAMVPLGNTQADADRAGVQWLGCFNAPTTRIPQAAEKFAQDYQTQVEKLTAATVPDPTVGHYSATNASASAKLTQISQNYQNGIISGHMPMSNLAKYRKEWRQAGGDKIRAEYQKALDKKS